MHENDPRPPVLNKADFFRRFYANEFGNRGPIWFKEQYDQWHITYLGATPTPDTTTFMIRETSAKAGGGIMLAWLKAYEVQSEWILRSAKAELSISLMAPHHHQTINGEVMRDHRGLCLYYSEVKEAMRPSLLKGGKQVFRLQAGMVLRQHLTPHDREWLMHLLNLYPDHVIEFTAFNRCWGTVPSSKCVIWEVRKY